MDNLAGEATVEAVKMAAKIRGSRRGSRQASQRGSRQGSKIDFSRYFKMFENETILERQF